MAKQSQKTTALSLGGKQLINLQPEIHLLPTPVEGKPEKDEAGLADSGPSGGTLAVWERGFPESRRLTASPRDATPRQRAARKKIPQRRSER